MARDQAGDTAEIWEGEGTPVGARAAAEAAAAAVGPWAETLGGKAQPAGREEDGCNG